jgi:hypothetical protein
VTDPAIPEPPHREPVPVEETASIGADVALLCARLCAAVGVDPDINQGFTLTVFGGNIPQLQVFPSPPGDEDGLTDPWSGPLTSAMIPTALAVLPGSDTQAPPVQVRPPLLPSDLVPSPVRADHMAIRVLLAMTDVLNGAGCDGEMRDWLDNTARQLADLFTGRVYDAAAAARKAQAATDAEEA